MIWTGWPVRRRVMARCRAVNSLSMGTSVVRPPAVAHGGHSRRWQLDEGCQKGAERRGGRQQSQRCTGGSPHENLNDVLAEIHQRCTVGSQLSFSILDVSGVSPLLQAWESSACRGDSQAKTR